jgi:hypothetical protein
MTAAYAIPDNPADPAAAALELIVRLHEDILHTSARLRTVLQDNCSVLDAEGCFAGLSWSDAKNVAAAVSFDLVTRDGAEAFIRHRARNARAGTDGMLWENRHGAARALNIAATVLGL